jgi:hypothetical protein
MTPWRAFFIAPIAPALIPATSVYLNHGRYQPLPMFLFFLMIYYGFQIIIGLPARMYLASKNKQNLYIYLSVGFLSFEIPYIVLTIFTWNANHYTLSGVLSPGLYAGILGALPALVFWLLNRPDKDAGLQIKPNR